MKSEPLLTIGGVASAIGAFLVLMQSFGIPITEAQSDAINNFVMIAAPIILALVGRQFVFAPDTVEDIAPHDPVPDPPLDPQDPATWR